MTRDLAADRDGIALNTGQVLWFWFKVKESPPAGQAVQKSAGQRLGQFDAAVFVGHILLVNGLNPPGTDRREWLTDRIRRFLA